MTRSAGWYLERNCMSRIGPKGRVRLIFFAMELPCAYAPNMGYPSARSVMPATSVTSATSATSVTSACRAAVWGNVEVLSWDCSGGSEPFGALAGQSRAASVPLRRYVRGPWKPKQDSRTVTPMGRRTRACNRLLSQSQCPLKTASTCIRSPPGMCDRWSRSIWWRPIPWGFRRCA